MKAQSLKQLGVWAGARLVQGDGERFAARVCTDTRQVQPGDLFIALVGEKFDGHDFVKEAVQKGAIGLVVSKTPEPGAVPESVGILKVADTLVALQSLAAAYRQSLSVKVAAVTGSSGKTSTKEMIASILERRYEVHKTHANLNNHIGLPLTLLDLDEDDEWCVVEIGMNQPGEILHLTRIARPDIAVITNIGWAHIAAFENQEAIASEKCDILVPLDESGVAIVNIEDPFLQNVAERTRAQVRWVGESMDCSVRFREPSFDSDLDGMRFRLEGAGFSLDARVPYPGIHMVENAVLAAQVGLEAGLEPVEVVEGLERVQFPKGRMGLYEWNGGYLLDDSYNANPDSMAAAFRSLSLLGSDGRKIALLGCMAELGDYSERLHTWVGARLGAEQFDGVYCVGEEADTLCQAAIQAGLPEERCHPCADPMEMATRYLENSQDGDHVLVKGSRLYELNRVAEHLMKEKGEAA